MKKFFLSLIFSFISISIFGETVTVLRDNAPLRTENKPGGVELAMRIPAGISLSLVSNEPVLKDLVTTQEITPDVSFYYVEYEGKNYYINANEVSLGSTPAVVIKDAILFTKPRLNYFRNSLLEKSTIVSFLGTYASFGVKFAEIEFFDETSWTKKTRYILSDKYSLYKDDISAIILINKVLTLKDKDLQKELLSSAKTLSLSNEILELVDSTFTSLFPTEVDTVNSEENIVYLEEFLSGYVYSSDESLINVREFPSIESKIVAQLNSETNISVKAYTKSEEEIDNFLGPWRLIVEEDSNVQGWVFGGYVRFDQ